MSLLHPTPGQVLDRLSILELKIDAHRRTKRSEQALLNETTELVEHLRQLNLYTTEVGDLAGELHRVNRGLWAAEDRVRALKWDEFVELAAAAKQIAQLNDKRMRLVREIDRAFGWLEGVEDKVYLDTPPAKV